MNGLLLGSVAWIIGESGAEQLAAWFGVEYEKSMSWWQYMLIALACIGAFLGTMVVLARYVWPSLTAVLVAIIPGLKGLLR